MCFLLTVAALKSQTSSQSWVFMSSLKFCDLTKTQIQVLELNRFVLISA